jgi:hypothetical protein
LHVLIGDLGNRIAYDVHLAQTSDHFAWSLGYSRFQSTS